MKNRERTREIVVAKRHRTWGKHRGRNQLGRVWCNVGTTPKGNSETRRYTHCEGNGYVNKMIEK